jgi:uncharacterized protein YjiS (DUF1127 family)
MNIFKRYYYYLCTWRQHRKVIKQLNELTDHELDDIGINRGDIDRLVWLEIDKQRRALNEKRD